MNMLKFSQREQIQNRMLFLFSKMIFALTLIFISQHALALACRYGHADGTIQHIQGAPAITLPQTIQNDAMIWRSSQYTATAVCYKDFREPSAENVYMYVNPKNAIFADNLQFGINVNGTDYLLVSGSTTKVKLNSIVPGCNNSNIEYCKQTTQTPLNYNYYLYIKKVGNTPTTGNYSGSDEITYFQLDGEGGLNSRGNYNLLINGLSSIAYTTCYANASFTPNSVDLGKILLADKIVGARADKNSSQFILTANIVCSEPLGIDIYFDSPEAISSDSLALELSNGLDLKIKNTDTQEYVKFKDVTTGFVKNGDLSPLRSYKYETELYWRTDNPTVGAFSATATVTFYYN